MGHAAVGWVIQDWGGSQRGGVGHKEVGWVMQGEVGPAGMGGSYWVGWCGNGVGHVWVGGSCRSWVGHAGMGWVMQGWRVRWVIQKWDGVGHEKY